MDTKMRLWNCWLYKYRHFWV